MKKLMLAAAVIIMVTAFSYGQTAKHKPKTKAVKKSAAVFVRVKFDPKRNPKLDLQKAIKTATKTGKHIILDVGGEWCSWCVYMDKFFFLNPTLAKFRNDNFVWLKVNYSEENENTTFLAQYPDIEGYPFLLVLDEAGKLIQSQETSSLEAGNGYDIAKFTAFLKKWAPVK